MTNQNKIKWAVLFTVLLTFTVTTVWGLSQSQNTAYAKTISGNGLGNQVVVREDSLCAINQAQFNQLISLGAEKVTIQVDGEDVEIVQIPKKSLKQKELKDLLDSLDCKVVKHSNFYYLLFSANVS